LIIKKKSTTTADRAGQQSAQKSITRLLVKSALIIEAIAKV
jgi:hypothetical protein